MRRLRRFLATPFGLAVLGLLVLAGWSAWSGGVFDGPVAQQVRASSLYVAPGMDLDRAEAERIIGNRRLVVVFAERGADLGELCDDTEDAADGTVVLLLSPGDGEFEHYGCAHLPGDDDENFGKAFVAETAVATGVDQFVDRPLSALKVAAVNYDGLVKAGVVPDGARTISPSLPRYLVAVAAVTAVLGGALALYLAGRRAGRLAAAHKDEREAASDVRGSRNARAAVLATHIIELDRRYPRGNAEFRTSYRALAADYAALVEDLTGDGDLDGDLDGGVAGRIDALTDRARALAGKR